MPSMQYDIWSVTPEADVDFYRAAATIAAAGSLTLLKTIPGRNGYGFKVSVTSDGNDATTVFTITGTIVGQTTDGGIGTDTITGVNTNTVSSTKYFSSVTSVVSSATSANNVSVGYTADLALPRTRIKGLYYVGSGSAGSIVITSANVTAPLYKIITPTSAASFADSLFMPAEGILVGGDARDDFATVTISNVTSFTLLCG
jgi:hypothetical protein